MRHSFRSGGGVVLWASAVRADSDIAVASVAPRSRTLRLSLFFISRVYLATSKPKSKALLLCLTWYSCCYIEGAEFFQKHLIMNRIFFHLLVIFSIACSREATLDVADDFSPEMAMGVSAEATSLTKGALVDDPEDMGSMGIYCAYTDDVKWWSGADFTKMSNSRFDINSNGEWVIYGTEVTWGYDSLDDYYTFFGYSPYGNDTQGVSPRIEAGELVVDYTVPASSLNQPDLMFATPRKDIHPQQVGTVALCFSHTLASVSFGVASSIDSKILAV